jgi:hypothetical protein
MIMRYWKKPSNVLSAWWKKKVSFGNIKNGNTMKSPPPSSTGRKRPFSGNFLKNPGKAGPIIKGLNRCLRRGTFRAGVFLLFIFTPLFFSCVALDPVRIPQGTLPVRAAVPEELLPRWLPFARGIDYFEGRILEPRLELWALRVDLAEPSLRIVVSGEEPLGGLIREGHIPSTKVSSFVKSRRCAAGINTNPFRPVSGQEGEDREIIGVTISGGIMVARPNPAYDALVFYAGGKAAILSQAEIDPGGAVQNAVGGFSIILRKETIPQRLSGAGGAPRHPRSAAGLSADGGTLYLLVIDGRRPGSRGATERETGLLLKQLGAADGLNFDGGGSTALALRYPNGRVRAVNTPIHNGVPRQERGVATCLGIALTPENPPPETLAQPATSVRRLRK